MTGEKEVFRLDQGEDLERPDVTGFEGRVALRRTSEGFVITGHNEDPQKLREDPNVLPTDGFVVGGSDYFTLY